MSDSFVFYRSWMDIIEESYRHDEYTRNALYVAILTYGITGVETYPTEVMFLKQVYAQIDSAQKKHKAREASGRVGGSRGTGESKARKGNKNASKRKQTQANDNVNGNANENANDNVNVNVNDNVNDNVNNNSYSVLPSEAASPDRGGSSADDTEIEWEEL